MTKLQPKKDAPDPQVNGGGSSCCPIAAALHGAWRFAVVSLGGFGVWAVAGRWFYAHTGEAGLYAASTVVFIGLAGLLMPPLLRGERRVTRFFACFIPAFLAYAIVWCAFWFLLRFGAGEWLGSLAGSIAFVLVTAWRMKHFNGWISSALIFFTAHTIGYFAGGQLMEFMLGDRGAMLFGGLSKTQLGMLAKLGWGLPYGLGFGAGMGYVYHRLQALPSNQAQSRDSSMA